MLCLAILSVLGQGMFGSPPALAAPSAPAVDRSAAIIDRMAADRRDMLDAMAKLQGEVSSLKEAMVKLASVPPPEAKVITLPGSPAPPPARIYVARDAAGFTWEDTDQDRLLDWIERRDVQKRKMSFVQPATVVRSYVLPTYTLPATAASAPALRTCVSGVGCSP